MSKKSKFILLVFSVIFLFTGVQAQKNTYSPYSRFGIGDIPKEGFGRNRAMGGIGIGLRDANHLNYLNPAANSAQDTMSFLFTTGIGGNTMTLASNEGNHSVSNVTLSHLAIGFPISRWWKTNFGLVPYSQMGYKLMHVDLQSDHYFEGEGGINQFFFGNAWQLTRNISAGVNVSYLFGSLSQNRDLTFHQRENMFAVKSKYRAIVGDFHFKYGLQFSDRLLEEYHYTLGVTYENKTPLSTKEDWVIINELSTSSGPVRDTVMNLIATASHIDLPSSYGVGFSFGRDNKFLFGADYSLREWSETSFLGQQSDSLVNSSSFKLGGQYIPDHTDFRNFLNRIHYRAGIHYTETYLSLGGHQLKDYGITLGVGIPYGNTRSSFNFAMDIGRRGTKDFNLIQENYIMFNFSLSLYDFWFFQRRYE